MNDGVFAEAARLLPPLLLIWATIFATYWVLGLVRWPRAGWRDRVVDACSTVEPAQLGGFRTSSLALISLVGLFLELLLIRWVTSEIRIFAYFKSLVLIASFLGFGLGCYLTSKRIRLGYVLLPVLAMLLVIELPWDPARRLMTNLSAFIGWFSDVHIWSRAYFADSALLGLATAVVAMSVVIPLFGLVAITFVPLGQLVGWYLEKAPRGILAYSVNIVASVLGIWLFTGLSFLSTPPVVWFLVFGLGLAAFCWRQRPLRRPVLVSIGAILVLFALGSQRTHWWGESSWKGSIAAEYELQPGQVETVWSPYQKLTLVPLLDSQTTSSSYTNIRLDNFVYTIEAMQATRALLKPNGLFVMSFSSERPWFARRLYDLVTRAFGREPLTIQTNVSFFVVGNGDRVQAVLAGNPALREFAESHASLAFEPAEITTDDWPYLYQQDRGIPAIVWLLSIGLVAMCWLCFRRLKPAGEGIRWHFFFLGAAFMLLEVQIISKAALLFGTTWLVNSIVITGLLAFILLSNLVVARYPDLPRSVAYWGLFATLLIGYLVPVNALSQESLVLRGLLASVLYCSPVFFAGIVFISSFREIGFRAEAFGSNLLGSLVGGLLESLSFVIGIKALVLVAALLYLLSLAAERRLRVPTPAVSPTVPSTS